MSTSALLRKMLEKGLTLEDACELIEVMEEGFAKPVAEMSAGALRTRKWRQRKDEASRGDVTGDANGDVTEIPLDKEKSPTPPKEIKPPLTPTNTRASRSARELAIEAKDAAGDALADMAVCPGVASVARLTALLKGDPACDWEADVLPAVVSAAAWHRKRGGKGSMRSWETAAQIAVQNRDSRLAGAPDKPKAAQLVVERDDDFWRAAVRRWLADRTQWTEAMGPRPDDPNTKVPSHILAEYSISSRSAA